MAKSLFGKFVSAGIATGALYGVTAIRSKQVRETNIIRQLDNHIYLLDFNSDYQLDKLLNQGVSNIAELLKFVCLTASIQEDSLKPGTDTGAGCSTFDTFTPNGEHILGRNFDFKTAPCFIVWTHPKNHYASISVVDNNFMAYGGSWHTYKENNALQTFMAPYCCVDGINEKGLSIAVLQIRAKATNQNVPGKKNITTTAMIRAVLDTCADVDEAVKLIESYNMHDSLFTNYHYQIADKSGRSVVVEYINDEIHIYEKNSEKYSVAGSVYEGETSRYQYVTNFSVTKDIGSFAAEQHGEDRADAIKNALDDCHDRMTEMEAMDLLSHVKLDYDHPKYPWRIGALWSAVYNCGKSELTLAAGMDYTKIYTFSVKEPLTVLKQDAITESAYETIDWAYL